MKKRKEKLLGMLKALNAKGVVEPWIEAAATAYHMVKNRLAELAEFEQQIKEAFPELAAPATAEKPAKPRRSTRKRARRIKQAAEQAPAEQPSPEKTKPRRRGRHHKRYMTAEQREAQSKRMKARWESMTPQQRAAQKRVLRERLKKARAAQRKKRREEAALR